MRKLFRTRRRKAFGGTLATLVVAGLVVGAALGYYGGSGSGSASASAGTAPRSVTVTGATNPNTALFPGESRPVDITVTLVGSGSARVGSISSSGITVSEPQASNGCLASWFSFTPPSSGFGVGSNVSSGSPLVLAGASSGASIAFQDAAVNQDACSNATLSIALQASPT